MAHPLVELAKLTIDTYITSGKIISPPEKLTPEMRQKAGVFVSIHLKNGALRGCIGTIEPTKNNVAEEIIGNAIEAATGDPRFSPVSQNELKSLDISVDVLTTPVKIPDASGLDVKKYGIVVKKGFRRGLLLPDIEGVDSVEEQVSIAKQKAGIPVSDSVELFRFEVIRYR